MKTKFLTLILFLGITTLIVSSCSFLRGTGSVSTDNKSICSNYSNSTKSQLEVGLVHEMTGNYQHTSNANDAKAIWFDLETIKKFIYHICLLYTSDAADE